MDALRDISGIQGFSLVEVMLVLALLLVAGGWGIHRWGQQLEEREGRRKLVRQLDHWMADARDRAQREGQVLRLRIEADMLRTEVGSEAFSTRWQCLDEKALAESWRLLEGQSSALLLLPHGRPADSVEWVFVQDGEAVSANALRLQVYLSGHIEWELP